MKQDMFDQLQKENPTAKINYYISYMDDRDEIQTVHTEDADQAQALFEQMKLTEYDMHLYKALSIDLGDDGFDLIHDEVIDTYVADDINF